MDNKTFVIFGQSLDDRGVSTNSFFRHEITELIQSGFEDKLTDFSENISGDIDVDMFDIDATRIKFGLEYCKIIP